MKERGEIYDIKTIERYEFDPEMLKNDMLLKQPLVFRGVAKDWTAVSIGAKNSSENITTKLRLRF